MLRLLTFDTAPAPPGSSSKLVTYFLFNRREIPLAAQAPHTTHGEVHSTRQDEAQHAIWQLAEPSCKSISRSQMAPSKRSECAQVSLPPTAESSNPTTAYLYMGGGTEDVDDSVSHIFSFETLERQERDSQSKGTSGSLPQGCVFPDHQ